MSKTIDEKVVSIQFDNQQFEKNVSTTMSTLDKLKQKLTFKDSSKGLENVSAAAKSIDMSGLSSGVENVRMRFSALEVMGVTALANITNSAVNAGKRMISALTIDPIKTGFQEYETQINATQTILANTQNKGSTIDDVNKALEELNKYADLTIYNFTEMTRNIGTFTAAGIDLETSVNAIQGIANLAAVSGSNSQQASTAMYQLSQALASGTVKLMDWNSVVNAGMGGEIFQNALKETSKLLGTGAEAAIEAEGSFRESLRTGWLTSEVLTETLKKFTTTGANEYVAEYTGLSVEAVQAALDSAEAQYGEAEAIEYASKALAEKSGKNADEIKQTLQFAKNAEDAATKVKTFTQLFDVMKEAAQSGWAQTWKIIVGDFEEAKNLLTPLADFFTKIIGKMSDFRNNILDVALSNNPFTKMSEKLSAIIKPVEKVADSVNKTISTIENLDEIARKVIHGDYKNTDTGRRENLMAEGYNWAIVQNRVNEMLGDSKRHSVEAAEAELQLYKAEHGLVEKGEELTNTQEKSNESRAETIEQLVGMSDAQLEELGLTKEEIKALRELAKICDAAGISISDFLADNSLLDGRTLLINSFKNIGEGITEFAKLVQKAWQEIFPPKSIEERAEKLYYLIAAFHKFTAPFKNLIDDSGELNETGKKLVRTLKGVFALLDLISTLTGGVFKIGVQIIKEFFKALGYVDIPILDITANIGDAIVAFNNWIQEHNLITKAISKVVPFLVKMGTAIVNLVKQAWNLPIVQEYVGKITGAFSNFKATVGGALDGIIEKLGKLDEITLGDITSALTTVVEAIQSFFLKIDEKYFGGAAGNIISGLANGIKEGAKTVWDAIVSLATELVARFKEALGIHSPSKVFFAIGGFIIAGLIGGLLSGGIELEGTVGTITEKITELFGKIDWSKIFASGISAGLLLIAKNLTDALNNFSSLAGGAGDVLSGVGEVLSKSAKGVGKILLNTAKVVKSFSKVMNSVAFKNNAEGIKTLAISLLMLVGAIAILTFLDVKKMWNAVGIIFALAAILAALSLAMAKISSSSMTISKEGIKIDTIKASLLNIGLALLMMAATVKIIGSMKPEQAIQGFIALKGMIASMIALVVIIAKLTKDGEAVNIDKTGKMLRKLATSLLIMAIVVKLLGGMSWENLGKAGAGMLGLIWIITILTFLSKAAGKDVDKFGSTMLKLSGSLLIMVIVLKLIAGMEWEDLIKAGVGIAGLVGVIALLMTISMIPGKNLDSLGTTMLKLSGSLLIMAFTLRILGGMSWENMIKAGIGLAGLVGIVAMLTVIGLMAGDKINSIGKTLIAISGAMLILAIVANIISMMSWEGMAKATIGLVGLVGIVAMLVLIVKMVEQDAPKIAATILTLSVSLAILAAIAIVLSLINLGGLAKGIIAISSLGLIMALLIYATKDAKECEGNIKAMAIAIGVMAAAIVILSFIKPEKLAGAVTALGILMGMFALMLKASEKAQKSIAPILGMVGIVAILAGMIYLLSMLKVDSVLEISASLSMLLMSLSISLMIISKTGKNALLAIPAALAMVGVLALIAIILGVLAALNIGSTLEIATSLSVLLLTMSVSMVIISAVGPAAIQAMPAAFAMVGVLALIAIILGVLAKLNVGPTLEIATSLSMLLISLSVACLIMAGAAVVASVAVAGLVPLIALIVGMGALMAAIAGLVTLVPDLEQFLSKALPILKLIGQGIGEFIGGIITGIGNAILGLLPQLGLALSAFAIGVQPFCILMKQVDDSVLAGVGYLTAAILALTVANFISGISQFMSFGQSFVDLGLKLTGFILAAWPFITMIKFIDPTSIEAAKSLAEMILVLSAADLLSGIGDLVGAFTGNSGFEGLGEKLKSFGSAVCEFSKSISGENAIDAAAVEAAAKAGLMVAELQKSLPRSGGWIQKLAGEQDLLKFSASLIAFGKCIRAFSISVSGDNAIDSEAVEAAVKAGNLMSKLQNSLPKTGGWIQQVAGEQDLAKFGLSCAAFGLAISLFSKSVSGDNAIDITAVEKAKNAGDLMSELQDTLPKSGGWWQEVAGEQDIGNFGGKIKAFGEALVDFSDTVGENINDTAVKAAVNTGTMMAELQKAIPTDKWFDGKVSIDDFGKKIKKFGEYLVDYSEEVSGISDMSVVESSVKQAKILVNIAKTASGIDSDKIDNFKNVKKIGEEIKGYADKVEGIDATTVANSVTSANKLKTLVLGLSGLDTSGISKFKVAGIGTSIKEYNDKVSGINTGSVSSSINCIQKLVTLIRSMSDINSSGISSFTTAVKELSTVQLNIIAKAFDGASSKMISSGVNIVNSILKGMKSKQRELISVTSSMISIIVNNLKHRSTVFTVIGSNLMLRLAAGIKTARVKVISAVTSSIASAASTAMIYRVSFYSAGSYVGSGFAAGIRAKIPSAVSAASDMGSAAAEALRKYLIINSPSKVFRKIGYSVPEGFAMGIDRLSYMAADSASNMGDIAVSEIGNSIALIADALNTDIDSQPTIRPVLDLSDVTSGASIISGLFDTPSIGVKSNLSAISSMMSERNQNGVDTEIVSAINKLRNDLGNIKGNTYNVNGITYDDGSNIANAVETLVRASVMERRM